mmetsp:Transcript_144937/g.251564  ORF Transcript_144937/g.251564 Transcript_144937/m.251564 type:complete len:169 (-) Transcript_144937:41-547(-)
MAAEQNRRQGIAFDYSQDRRRSRSPRRSWRRQGKEDDRRSMREKRKALWSGQVPSAAPAGKSGRLNAEGTDSESSEEDDASRGKPQESQASANGWEHSSFGSSDEKNKFLRLMGASKAKAGGTDGDPADAAAARTSSSAVAARSRELERQYWQGQHQRARGYTRGLGS